MTEQATPPANEPATPPATPPANEPVKVAEAPDSYAAFNVPEGAALEGEALTAVQSFAKELKLTQEQAQKLVDRDFAQRAAAEQALSEQAEATRNEWAAAAKADKEFGGDKFDENMAVAKKALDAIGDDELKKLLDLTGRGSHPSVIRAFWKVGQLLGEDKLIQGGATPPAKRLYGNSDHAL